ncbi:zinc finger protein 618-like isoform X9 [Pleurodeles waltl]|uniref:zinc finger protein 618-like isoform X9 n=1 Tax=Pleurodeles waltl TaxID=8319 RepID=UPI0037098AEE
MSAPDVTVKTEAPDEEVQAVIWQDDAKESSKNSMDNATVEGPAEICVVIGDARNQQPLENNLIIVDRHQVSGGDSPERRTAVLSRESSWSGSNRQRGVSQRINTSSPGSYECGICGKKYKYYNCFQTHVRAHRDTESTSGEPAPPGGKTGNYTCEFCGKQYKYYTPYQEHVALHAPIKSAFCRKLEVKSQNNFDEANSNSQHSSGPLQLFPVTSEREAASPLMPNAFPLLQKQMQHGHQKCTLPASGPRPTLEASPSMERVTSPSNSIGSLVPQNRNHFALRTGKDPWTGVGEVRTPKVAEPYTCGACGIQFQFYNNLLEHMQSHAAGSILGANSSLPEKERQRIAERLLRMMCADLGALSVVNGAEFIKLAQSLVDAGARYGTFSVTEILGNMNSLALKHLPRMYNQVKVKVTCALGSNACLGIGVTCHSQSVGLDSCFILTAYQVECNQIKRYVLGIKDVDNRDNGDFIHQWVQNVLSEFVMSDIRTVYVTDCKVNSFAFLKAGMCLRCSACALNSVVQSVLNKRTLQARNMHEVIELLNVTEDLAGSTGLSKETFGSLQETSPPPCWNSVTDSLLLVHERYEQICEFYTRAKKMTIIQNLNKHLLSNLAAILAPVKQAVIELSNESKPTLQLVLPTYVKLEKLFTSKANDAGVISKLCHLFLEALKENFKVDSAHKVAMILDPQQKLRPVPPYQQEEIIGKVCELINEVRELGVEETEFEPTNKKARTADDTPNIQEDDRFGKNEVYDYLQEPLFQVTPDLFQYWSSVTQKHTKLARLAFWLLAVPAVGARSECVSMCEQTLLIKRRRLLSPENMNKLLFLKSNMI